MRRLTVTPEGVKNAVVFGVAGALFGLGQVAYHEVSGEPLVPQAEAELGDASADVQHAQGGLDAATARVIAFEQDIGSLCLGEITRYGDHDTSEAALAEDARSIAGEQGEPCGSDEGRVREILEDNARLRRDAGFARASVRYAEEDFHDAQIALQEARDQATDADGDGVGQEDLMLPVVKGTFGGVVIGVMLPFEVRVPRRRTADAYRG